MPSRESRPVVGPVDIHTLQRDGRGVGRLGARTVVVSQAYPGDSVITRVDVETKSVFQGRVKRVVSSSATRRPSPCAHADWCTGCPYLGVDRDAEIGWKKGFVEDEARKQGIELPEGWRFETPTSPYEWRHFAKQIFGLRDGHLVLGSYVQGTHVVVDNARCSVLVPELQVLLERVVAAARHVEARPDNVGSPGLLHVLARASRVGGQSQLVIATRDPSGADALAIFEKIVPLDPELVSGWVLIQETPSNNLLEGRALHVHGFRDLTDTLLDVECRIGPASFFQANPACAETMFREAVERAGAGRSALDLYSGVGILAVGLAKRFERVTAVEAVEEAASLIAKNAAKAGVSVDAVHADVETAVDLLLDRGPFDVVVADPPRKGLGPRGTHVVTRLAPVRLVLLSCDLSAWGKDARTLADSGYKLAAFSVYDAFPRTAHVEVLSVFERV